MRNLYSAIIIAVTFIAYPAQATDFYSKSIATYFFDTRACTFFTLSGVAQADPITPNAPYFALAKTHPNYSEMNALLLTAKTLQRPVDLSTNGQLACGHAEVSKVILP